MTFPLPKLLLALSLAALPSLLRAECVTAESLAGGVTFKREDGHSGLIQTAGKGFAIDYATNSKTAWTDHSETLRGIYETGWQSVPTDEYYVGGGPGGDFSYEFTGKPPVPAAGKRWKTKVSERKSLEAGLESGPEVTRTSYAVTYSFRASKTAQLSGFSYTIQPVEAVFQNNDTHLTRRWIYFPHLGFGLETRVTDHIGGSSRELGLTALTPKG